MAEDPKATSGFVIQDDVTGQASFATGGGGRTVTVQLHPGQEEAGGIRRATTVTAFVVRAGQQFEVGSVSAVDFRGVTFQSLAPQTLTFHVPIGCTGLIKVSGGKPRKVFVTQVGP